MKKVLSKDIPYTVIHSLYSDTQGNIGIISFTVSPSSSSNNMLVWNPGQHLLLYQLPQDSKIQFRCLHLQNPQLTLHLFQ